jgi:hypothetical protein
MSATTNHQYSGIPALAPLEFFTNLMLQSASRANPPKQVEKNGMQASKIAAWALIGGVANTIYTLCQAQGTSCSISLRGAFLRGCLAGGVFKAALSSRIMHKTISFTVNKKFQHPPSAHELFIKTSQRVVNLSRWLIT